MNFEKTVPLLEAAFKEEQAKRPNSNKALVWALAHVFKRSLISRFVYQFIFKVLGMVGPLLIFRFTEFLEKSEEDIQPDDVWMATLLTISIVGLEIVEQFSHSIFDFHKMAFYAVT